MRVNAQAISKAVQRRMPIALEESWLRETWSGGHGRLRLQNHVNEVTSVTYLGEATVGGEASMVGIISRRSGGEVGSASRTVSLHSNGRLNVHHSELSLDDTVHRTGFASGFNGSAYKRYEQAGVDDVTLSAGLSAGGYVWARRGFELAPAASVIGEQAQALTRARTIRAIAVDALERGRITPRQFEQLQPRLLSGSEELHANTLTSVQELAGLGRVGEQVLKGSTWKGLRAIESARPWWASTRAGMPAALQDSRAGVAHLRNELEVPDAVQHVRREVALQLPDVLEPGSLNRMLERATVGGEVRLVGTGNAIAAIDLIEPGIVTRAPMRVLDKSNSQVGSVTFIVESGKDGALVATRDYHLYPEVGRPALHRVTNDVLRGAGVTELETFVRPRPGSSDLVPRTYQFT